MEIRYKPSLRLAVLGHVDAGKTSVVGRLLEKHDNFNSIAQCCEIGANEVASTQDPFADRRYHDLYQKYQISEATGRDDLKFLQIESYRYTLTLYHASAFRDFIKKMMAGLNGSHTSLLVVAAAPGEFEAGISQYGQTRDHLLVANTLGVTQVLVAVNKMDGANYSQERYEEIVTELLRLAKKIGYQSDALTFVPISSWRYDVNFDSSPRALMPWYNGPTLIQAINELKPPTRPINLPLRFIVQDIFSVKSGGAVAVGRVETGVMRMNDKILIAPGDVTGSVISIQMNNKSINEAYPGDSIGVCMDGAVSSQSLRRGYVVGHADHAPPAEVVDFVASLIILNHPGQIHEGYSPVIECHSARVACKFSKIISKYDRTSLKFIEQDTENKGLKRGDKALVRLVPLKPMVVEACDEFAPLGRFMVHDMRITVATGIIMSVNRKPK